MTHQLPAGYEDIQPYADTWALATFSQRQSQRLASSMEDITAFYQAMMPRFDEVLTHLNRFDLNELPEAEQTLMHMSLSLAQIGPCVALWRAPDQENAFDAERMEAILDD